MSTHVPPAPTNPAAGTRLDRFSHRQLVVGVVALAAALGGISLIITAAIDYDPDGWIVYAREVFGHGVLDTNTYPSWKPLPIVLIGPFTLLTHGFADVYWWLWICRTLGILAVFGGAAVAYRLAGKWAALIAGVVMLLAPWWLEETMTGRDGAASAGLIMISLYGYYRNWTRVSGICLVGAALLRPEMTPFAILYGLWAWRLGRLTLLEVVLAVVVIGGLWEVPSLLHAGKSASALADNGGVGGTPVRAKIPFLDVLIDSYHEMRLVPSAFVLVSVLSTIWGLLPRGQGSRIASLWGRDNFERVLIAFAALWVLIIASETEFFHFSGNQRYQIPGLCVWAVIAAVTAVRCGGLVKIASSAKWGVWAATAVMLIPIAITCHGSVKSGVDFIKLRQTQVNSINTELAQLRCPGYKWANASNNAYLAVITGQSLPATILPSTVPQQAVNGQYQFVYCAPANFVPAGKA